MVKNYLLLSYFGGYKHNVPLSGTYNPVSNGSNPILDEYKDYASYLRSEGNPAATIWDAIFPTLTNLEPDFKRLLNVIIDASNHQGTLGLTLDKILPSTHGWIIGFAVATYLEKSRSSIYKVNDMTFVATASREIGLVNMHDTRFYASITPPPSRDSDGEIAYSFNQQRYPFFEFTLLRRIKDFRMREKFIELFHSLPCLPWWLQALLYIVQTNYLISKKVGSVTVAENISTDVSYINSYSPGLMMEQPNRRVTSISALGNVLYNKVMNHGLSLFGTNVDELCLSHPWVSDKITKDVIFPRSNSETSRQKEVKLWADEDGNNYSSSRLIAGVGSVRKGQATSKSFWQVGTILSDSVIAEVNEYPLFVNDLSRGYFNVQSTLRASGSHIIVNEQGEPLSSRSSAPNPLMADNSLKAYRKIKLK